MRLRMSPTNFYREDTSLDIVAVDLKRNERNRVPTGQSSAAIDVLPVELLIQIFVLCAQAPTETLLAPLSISQVCRFWREIALSSPHIWQHIYLDDKLRSIHISHYQADLWACRSCPLPLIIHVNLADADNLLPLLSPLLPDASRWRRVQLTGQLEEEVDFTSFSQEGSEATLDSLTIAIKGLDAPIIPEGADTSAKTFHAHPPLTLGSHTSRFHKIVMRTEVTDLPRNDQLTTLYLHNLTIKENSLDTLPDPAQIILLLQSCPELKIFHYHALPHESEPVLPAGTKLPIAPLHRLHTLLLRSTCAVRAILSHIDAPVLRELYLEQTNMEFELRHAATYSAAAEEGDSEDEAHDFSQSPWSDYATGMGLRSLLSRCNPPLSVLEMDYADMRTKDFLWCFDRLRSLQEFRIVASDMSNTVIAMLAPFHRQSSSSNLSTDVEQEVSTAQTVRLPRLSSLEIRNCQRLTGNAITDALGARTRYTDALPDRHEVSKFSDVAIVGCVDFLPHHTVTLSHVLGNRLRVHE